MGYLENYEHWLSFADCENNLSEKEKEDRFYKDLEFGTGGLRGVIAAGTNRMNEWTVAKASKGLADYVGADGSIVISYDSRNKSKDFAKIAAEVFAKKGIRVFIFDRLMPTPVLSFATRYLNCSSGIMITASHNPAQYNGYKVYGPDGCQITTEDADHIQSAINSVEISTVTRADFEECISSGLIQWVGDEVLDAYIDAVELQSVDGDRDIRIIYSPLNGTGLESITRVLDEVGFRDVIVVGEQKNPDGCFPTCPYPNPENKDAMKLGLEYMKRYNGDVFIATDPDCDRVGVGIKDIDEYKLMTGNQVGALLIDYLIKNKEYNENAALVKTIVTSELGAEIARKYGIQVFEVLTGFKYIGERIGQFEKRGDYEFFFGYEESYGYLVGTHAKDKDAVVASMLICEMVAYWKKKGISLWQRMGNLYKDYGYYKDALDSLTLEGKDGTDRIKKMMNNLRTGEKLFEGRMIDYIESVEAEPGYGFLPSADVLKYNLQDGSWVAIRPSGTEPKIKIYYSIKSETENNAERKLEECRSKVTERLEI